MPEDQSYEWLVRQAQQADDNERRELLEKIVAQFAETAFHWALAVLEDENAAYDALQEAWLNAFLHLDQLRESAAFPGWFRQIVVTAAYRALRRDDPSIPLPEENAAPQPDFTEEFDTKERQDHIREAVLALPDHERIVTELFYFADYPQQEIAEVLAVPLTTVKKRLQYARQRLKGIIHPDIVSQLYALNGGCTAAAIDYYELIPMGRIQILEDALDEAEFLCSTGQTS